MVNNNNIMRGLEIKELVQDYMKDNDDIHDTDRIHEYVDGMLPCYFAECYAEYHHYIGTPLNIEITQFMVGMQVWQIMNMELFDVYYELFMDELNRVVEEE